MRTLASAAAASALLSLVSGCAGEVRVEAVLPADVDDGALAEVRSFEIVATEGSSGTERVASSTQVGKLSIPDLSEGRWTFFLEATDASGRVLLQAEAGPLAVTRSGEATVRAVLAPVESIVRLPAGGAAADEIAQLQGLSATTFSADLGAALVLIAGGDAGDGPTRQAWVYDPARVAFEAVGRMRCPRAGHAATTVAIGDGREAVLVAGGGSEPCGTGASSATAANSIELFDPDNRSFDVLEVGWHSRPPDLSSAQLAPLAPLDSRRVVLSADGEIWVLDLDRPAAWQELPDAEADVAEGRLAADPATGAVAIVGDARIGLFDLFGNYCGSTERAGALAGTPVTAAVHWGSRLFVAEGMDWSLLEVRADCSLTDDLYQGDLARGAAGATTTALGDGRILIVGGAAAAGAADTELLLPACGRSTVPLLRPGPAARHTGSGHAAAALPDGSALILGGGAEAELFSPLRLRPRPTGNSCWWPEQTSRFDREARPDLNEKNRIVVVMDATPAAASLREDLGQRARNMMPRQEGLDGEMAEGIEAGVIPATAAVTSIDVEGCETPGDLGWVSSVPVPSHLVDAELNETEFENRVEVEDAARTGCLVRQPLAVVQELVRQFEAGEGVLVGALGNTVGSILVVLVAAGDDCSNDPGFEGVPGAFDPELCVDLEAALLEPEDVAGRVVALADDLEATGLRFAVAVVHGVPGRTSCEPPPRLARFLGALGERGHEAPICADAGADDEVFAALNRVSAVASFFTYRSVCGPLGAATDEDRCMVVMRWRDGDVVDLSRLTRPTDWELIADTSGCGETADTTGPALRILSAFTHAGAGGFEQFLGLCW